jgi:hypothetical protein
MKNARLVAAALVAASFATPAWPASRRVRVDTARVVALPPAAFAVSPPLRDLPAWRAPALAPAAIRPSLTARPPVTATGSPDAALHYWMPAPLIPGPSTVFEGLRNADNFALLGVRVAPPDTAGDVGPQHYVQATNLALRVFNRTGSPLTAALPLSALFAGLAGACNGRNDGQPSVLYDPLADRWVIAQTCAVNPPHQLVAVSVSGDPAGAYLLYDFTLPNAKQADAPRFGVWRDAYFMAQDQYVGTTFAGSGVYAFDRARLLAGQPSAAVYIDLAGVDATLSGLLPADMDGLRAPDAGAPGLFAALAATERGDPADAVRLFEFTPNFATPTASTFAERGESPLAVAAFDPRTPPGLDHVEQPPPADEATESLDSVSDRLMPRLAWRHNGATESLVVNHTVNAGAGTTIAAHQAAVRYYELRRPLAGAFTVAEQATFAPDAHNRWAGSAAIDHQGNLAVGYSLSSLTQMPSVRYAGRLFGDPGGGLFQGEAVLHAGTFVQRSASSRWGRGSALAIDPVDDCAFWYTQEYYAADDPDTLLEWQTRVGRFAFTECVPAPRATLQGTVRNTLGQAVSGALLRTTSGHSRGTSVSGAYSFRLLPGAYDVNVTHACYQPGSTSATLAAGGTEVRDVTLAPATTATITAPTSAAVNAQNVTASLPPHAGSTYTWSIRGRLGNDLNGLITAGQGTATLTFRAAAPGETMFVSALETTAAGCPVPAPARAVQVHFLDVPPGHPFHDFVNVIAARGITAGCGGGNYCPTGATQRRQMAIFLLTAKEGSGYAPPPATGIFSDVPAGDPFAPWIEELFRRGVTSGCAVSPLRFCPTAEVARRQMAVFLLATREPPGYTPPPATGVFADVPAGDPFAPWIEELFRRGVTAGCSANPLSFCPHAGVTRGEMAVFLVRTFALTFP